MMRLVLIAAALICGGSAATAQPSQVRGIEIFDAGIYERSVASSHRGPDGVIQSVTEDQRLVEATTRIPMRPGVAFGFGYRITGDPEGANVALRRVTLYPPPGARPPGSRSPLRESSAPEQGVIGGIRYVDYRFDEAWELIPGIWTIEIREGERLLGSQHFTVVAPQQFALAAP